MTTILRLIRPLVPRREASLSLKLPWEITSGGIAISATERGEAPNKEAMHAQPSEKLKRKPRQPSEQGKADSPTELTKISSSEKLIKWV